MAQWLTGCDERTLREAVGEALPEVKLGHLDMGRADPDAKPIYAAAAVSDDAGHVVKFAWSEEAAASLLRELVVLQTLAGVLPVPRLIATSIEPLLMVTSRVDGIPLRGDDPAFQEDVGPDRVAKALGTSLARLHRAEVQQEIAAKVCLPRSQAQATPDMIRAGLQPWVTDRQWPLVLGWCDWVERTLERPWAEATLVHGDLHGYNQIWSPGLTELRAILDWASVSVGDAEFDFRYFPDQVADHPDFVVQAAAHYEAAGGRHLDLERILAWHVLTLLGDALWRSEAGIPLPDGRTPPEWVDGLEWRLGRPRQGPLMSAETALLAARSTAATVGDDARAASA